MQCGVEKRLATAARASSAPAELPYPLCFAPRTSETIVSLSTSGAWRLPNAVGSPSESGIIGFPSIGSRFCEVIFSMMARIGFAVLCALTDMATCHVLACWVEVAPVSVLFRFAGDVG